MNDQLILGRVSSLIPDQPSFHVCDGRRRPGVQPELRLKRFPQVVLQKRALEAFVAAVARNSDVIAPDPSVLEVAEAVFTAFSSRRSSGGLTSVFR